jgi:hypothetical protein
MHEYHENEKARTRKARNPIVFIKRASIPSTHPVSNRRKRLFHIERLLAPHKIHVSDDKPHAGPPFAAGRSALYEAQPVPHVVLRLLHALVATHADKKDGLADRMEEELVRGIVLISGGAWHIEMALIDNNR